MALSSTKNPLLQKVRHAAQAGDMLEDGTIVAEGPHLLAEALRGAWTVEHVFTTPEGRERFQELLWRAGEQTKAEFTEVAARAFDSLSATGHSQQILSLVRPRAWTNADVFRGPGPVIVLDGVQDPGNAGTIFRSAEAFGASAVVLTEGCVRISNGKLIRAATGSLFRLPFLKGISRTNIIRDLKSAGFRLYALVSSGLAPLPAADLCARFALVVGSEGGGVSPELLAVAESLSIPTQRVESLNAAIACSIALFEASRQRGAAPTPQPRGKL